MQKTQTRCLALLLCLFTLLACLPSASATEADPETQAVDSEEAETSVPEPPDPDEAPAPEDSPPVSEESPQPEMSQDESAEGDSSAIMPLADRDYTFTSLLTSSETSSANNHLNYTGGSGTHAIPVHQVRFGGSTYWAYCADNRKDWPGSRYDNYTQQSLPSSGLYQVQKVAMQLGFGDNDTARLEQLFGYDLNNYQAYQATQAVLWAAQVWEEEWSYLGSALSTIREGLTNYWKIATPSGRSADARNFALALADAVQAVYEDGIGCTMSTTTQSECTIYIRYQLTVRPRNYFGGYSLTLSGLPSGSTVSTSDGDLSNLSASGYTSSQATGTDTVTITVPKAAASRSFTLTATATPYVRQYRSNSAVGFLRSGSGSYQDILFAGGSLSAAPVTGRVTRTVPALPDGSITVTKRDAETGEPVPGVVFALYEYDGSDYVHTGKTAASNASGVASFTGLQYSSANRGLYRVFEVSSDTHQVWTSPYVCWVSLASGQWYSYETPDGQRKEGKAAQNSTGSYDFTFSFTAYNQPLERTGSLTLRKQDGSGTPLAEVSFVVTDEAGTAVLFSQTSEGDYLPDSEGSPLLTTDAKGEIQVTELPFGTYLVTEVETAEGGYNLLPTAFSVTLPHTGQDGEEELELAYTVVNHSTFTLPATGGWGLDGPVFLGLSLLALAVIRYTKGNIHPVHHAQKRSLHL